MALPIILASSSPYRRELLARLNLPFECHSPDIDEMPLTGEPPALLAARLALGKAQAVAKAIAAPSLIIGSDQVASLDGEPLGKPGNRDNAREQLRRASGQAVEFHTAAAVLASDSGESAAFSDLTRVRFRVLQDAEINRYLDIEAPFDCAGSFKAEALGITLFDAVESSDPTALIGLPLVALSRALRHFGYDLP